MRLSGSQGNLEIEFCSLIWELFSRFEELSWLVVLQSLSIPKLIINTHDAINPEKPRSISFMFELALIL